MIRCKWAVEYNRSGQYDYEDDVKIGKDETMENGFHLDPTVVINTHLPSALRVEPPLSRHL
jgi:hypothetical protein